MDQLQNFFKMFKDRIIHYCRSITSVMLPNFVIPNPSVPPAALSLESAMTQPTNEDQLEEHRSTNSTAGTGIRFENFDWSMLFMVFCLTSGVEITLCTLEGNGHTHIGSLQLLSFFILLAFALLFVATFIKRNHPVGSRVLKRAGILFATTAFCHVMTIPFPFFLKACSWGVYLLSLLAIAICNRS